MSPLPSNVRFACCACALTAALHARGASADAQQPRESERAASVAAKPEQAASDRMKRAQPSSSASGATSQRPSEQLDSAALLHRIEKLGVLHSVLYLAAHPDDENTRLISYLSNGRKARTAYLSLTRGDGGQNLIGPELGAALGVLRTQELLEARRIDGGEQFFTRAVDFGYSKSADETLAKWGRGELLADVVRVVRTFRPDVIITRFSTDGSGGHGQHTASALLANDAFDAAADPHAFPEQLAQGLEPWQVKRLYFNASTWWNAKLADDVRDHPDGWVELDVGGFDPLLGMSYTEIAGKSRSQHKSQGFGSAETRGSQPEYLRFVKGDGAHAKDLFEGIEPTWSRFVGSERALDAWRRLVDGYDLRAPERSIAGLADVARELDALAARAGPARAWALHHASAARELMLQCCGVALEANAEIDHVAQGETLRGTLSALARREHPSLELATLAEPASAPAARDDVLASLTRELRPLPWNRALNVELELATSAGVDTDAAIDEPYWLAAPHDTLFHPRAGNFGIEPVAAPALRVRELLRWSDGRELALERPLMRTWVDRVAGQRTRNVALTPVASIEPQDAVALATGARVDVTVALEALCDDLSGELRASAPRGWTLERATETISGLKRGQRVEWRVALRRAPDAVAGPLCFSFSGPKGTATRARRVIDYPHILPQTWYAPSDVQLVPLDVAVDVRDVGFVEGVGDDMPRALQRLGIAVERIDPATARDADLDTYDAIVTGIRAYNTVSELARFQTRLLAYVERGGTLLVQYNTSGSDLVLDAHAIGPWPFALTRGRVTLEDAEPTLLAPDHALLRAPNRIGRADFDAWVQERGLYFAGELDARYTPLIAWSDPGEAPLSGALITTDYGAGRFTYTGLSLFRQLPAGVPGAYRLLANLLSRRSARVARATGALDVSAPSSHAASAR